MRRIVTLSVACVTLAAVPACATAETDARADCPPVTSTDLNSQDGWLGMIEQSPETVSLVIDDGRGRTVEHRSEAQQVLASAMKVVHLGAYARAVAAGALDPDEQIPLVDWERWYVPGTDGGAHPAALDRLGIANDGSSATGLGATGLGAAGLGSTVRLDDMVTAMIQESDNSVPDYLRFRLGDTALVDAAAAGGWDGFEAPTLVGDILALLDPDLVEGDLVEPDRWATANRWAFDQSFRESVSASVQIPTYDEQVSSIENSFLRGSADQLSSLYRSFTDGSYGNGSDVVLRHLEYQAAPDGALGLGFKGGSLPGVLTQAFELRRDDGTVATAVWLTDQLPADRYEAALAGNSVQQGLIVGAMDSPGTLDRITCVV